MFFAHDWIMFIVNVWFFSEDYFSLTFNFAHLPSTQILIPGKIQYK